MRTPQPSALKNKPSLRELLKIVGPSFTRHKLRIVGGLIALVTVDFLQLIIPRILRSGIDSLNSSAVQVNLAHLGLLIIAIASIVTVLRFCWRYMIIGFSRILECSVRSTLFGHILEMDALFFERNTTGKLMSHSSNDLSAVQMAFGMGTVAAIDSTVMLFAAVGFMMAINVKLTLLALLPMPFLAISTRILSGKLHNRFQTVQEQFSELTEFTRSTISSMRLVKAYTMENLQLKRFDTMGQKYVRANLKVAVINGLMQPISTLVGNLGMLLVFFYGGKMVIEGTLSLGSFVAFITYLYMLIWPMMAIGWVANLVQRGLTSLGRLHNLLEQRPVVTGGNKTIETTKPDLEFKDLTFSYPASSNKALSHITLSFHEGIYGITGRTGSGKTTLCRLICRLYPVNTGQLFFCETDVNELPIEIIQHQIAYVSQEPVLFSDTIANNIRFGHADASHQQIEVAAQFAAIHEDIMALKHGYETRIGERGVKLSGGQRQRLSLARALLSKRPILLIDDGLSAVDVETEHQIFSRLKEHVQSKITIIVSNRIKLLSMTDEIIILHDGNVEHRGNHLELLKTSSLYQSMSEKQNSAEREQQ